MRRLELSGCGKRMGMTEFQSIFPSNCLLLAHNDMAGIRLAAVYAIAYVGYPFASYIGAGGLGDFDFLVD